MTGDSITGPRVLKRMEELTQENWENENRIHELVGLFAADCLNNMEFDLQKQ